MKRNAYLINQYLKEYMLATILTIAALQINGVVDSLIVGNFIGAEALAAINVSSPALTIIGGFSSLLAGGAIILVGKSLGARDYDTTNQIVITVLLSVIGAGFIISIISLFIIDKVANMICIGNDLYPLVRTYLGVILFGSVIIILNNALDSLTEVGGNPKIVSQTAVVNCVVNLIMDFILVGGLGLGIQGAAIATLMGAGASACWLFRFMKSEKSPYKLTLHGLNFMSRLKDNIKEGIPLLANAIAGTALMLLLNYFVQKMQGEAGMFAMSIMLVSMGIGLMLAGGSGAAFLAIGSMLYGRGDYVGLRALYKRCVVIGISAAVVATITAQIAPGFVAEIFGARDQQYIDIAERAFPLASWFMFALSLLSILAVVYQVLEFKKLCIPAIASLPIVTALGFGYVYYMGLYDYMWYVFPLAGFTALATILIAAEFVRRKSDKKLSVISLLPLDDNEVIKKNVSVSMKCDHAGIVEELTELRVFTEELNLGKKRTDGLMHCVEEMLLNILEHSDHDKNTYVDLGVTIKDGIMTAYIQDNGKPFDPTKEDSEYESIGLKILKHYCSDITYQYAFGQNAVFMKWPLKD